LRGKLVACACLAALAAAAPAAAGSGLLVGVDDDGFKWLNRAQTQTSMWFARDLGLRAVRVTVPWHAGQTRLSLQDRRPVDRAIVMSWGMRIVLAVYGRPDDAPQDAIARSQYCGFVASLLRRYPAVNDVVIWNEPNVGRFWRPQFAQDGSSAAPAAYGALLAECYDTLHGVRPSVNVIAASSPRGNDRPSAQSNVSHSPGNFYRKLGEAYRASGRTRPLFDTVGHNPYPNTNSERVWTRHPGTSIGQGDLDKLLTALSDGFSGTAQPLPGMGRVSVWYMEQGFQTTIDAAKRGLYHGTETDRQALPAVASRAAAGSDSLAADQATQLADALRLAYCQPEVGAFFNFELADEPNLAGWQSGLLWADLTPKPSYAAFKSAIAEVRAGAVDCGRFTEPKQEETPKTEPPKDDGPEIGFKPKPKPKKVPVVVVK
jgi:hypothetical protein